MAVEDMHKKEPKLVGIHGMRADRYARTPEYHCPNCDCKRYSPCGCIKGPEHREEKSKAVIDSNA
jgi:hypothetical protein